MSFYSNLSWATLGFVINPAPVCHLRAASAGSWLRREQRSWFFRDGKAQYSLHQKDLTIFPFPIPVCTCLCLEQGRWVTAHAGPLPSLRSALFAPWPVIPRRKSAAGSEQQGWGFWLWWTGRLWCPCAKGRMRQSPPRSFLPPCPSPSFPPSLPWVPREDALGMGHLLLVSESCGCVWVQREERAKHKHHGCLSLQGARIAAGALSGPTFLCPLVLFPLTNQELYGHSGN